MSVETGSEIKRSLCRICNDGCVIGLEIKNGVVEQCITYEADGPDADKPCVKGKAFPQYIHNKDRIKTPLRRIGERGEGIFEAISWDEAYTEIASRLNSYKAEFGPNSVAFYSGWTKWYRFMLQRLCYSFGSVNYGTESSSCHLSGVMAARIATGYNARPDIKNASLAVIFTFSDNRDDIYAAQKARGLKVISVDTKYTLNAQRSSDLHLQIRPGTDCALAHCFARTIILSGKADQDFINNRSYGYSEYAEYVSNFTPEVTSQLTELAVEDIVKACTMIAEVDGPIAVAGTETGLIHHKNGMQTVRAVYALSAIAGYYDKVGGLIPFEDAWRHSFLADGVLNLEFMLEKMPENYRSRIGAGTYPLWIELNDEFQAMDLPRHIFTQEPYPLKAIFALGFNARMFPDNNTMFEALSKIDFFVDADIFMTDTAKYADIVLPVCTSAERCELAGGKKNVTFIHPAIAPLYESRSDADIICELAEALNLDDTVLRGGYESCCRYILRELPFSLDDLKASEEYFDTGVKNLPAGETTKNGFNTPTGKYELKSSLIEKHPEWGLDALPTYKDPMDSASETDFPMVLVSGTRYPYLLHSRAAHLDWLKYLRPEPMADINPDDGAKLGISHLEPIELTTSNGSIKVKANLNCMIKQGTVGMYHGYSNADINAIIPAGHHDPYSGFPGFKSVRCRVTKEQVK